MPFIFSFLPKNTPDESTSSVRGRLPWSWIAGIAGIVAIAGGLGILFFVPIPYHTEIRLPKADEEIPLDHFHWDGAINARSIATVETCFTRSTWITTEVYAVENGETTLIASKMTGRSSKLSRPDDPYLMRFPVTFALADAEWEEGHTTLLTMLGASRSFGNFGGIHQPFEAIQSRTFPGRIDPGKERLLYIEGDRDFIGHPEMTVEEFAGENNKGHFLVVKIGFER